MIAPDFDVEVLRLWARRAFVTLDDGRTRTGREERRLIERGYLAKTVRERPGRDLYAITDAGREALARATGEGA